MSQSEYVTFRQELKKTLEDLEQMLCEKNKQYGNSALNPLRICSKASTIEQLHVRIDDKLSRIKRGTDETEDTYKDLAGYFILLCMARNEEIKKEIDRQTSAQVNSLTRP